MTPLVDEKLEQPTFTWSLSFKKRSRFLLRGKWIKEPFDINRQLQLENFVKDYAEVKDLIKHSGLEGYFKEIKWKV